MKKLLSLIFCLFIVKANGQSPTEVEQQLLKQFKKINYWSTYESSDDKIDKRDSLKVANDDFYKSLLKYTSRQPATINYDFKELEKEGLIIATSKDGLLRIYSWDRHSCSTVHCFDNIVQYKSRGKVLSKGYSVTDEGGGVWYSDIYSLQKGGQVYYLAVHHAIYNTPHRSSGINAIRIDNGSLNASENLFKTQMGIGRSLEVDYDFFTSDDVSQLIRYDFDQRNISLPVVDGSNRITNKRIVYQFTGEYFERKK